jgi:predicted ArsR family transcriptional regulator
MSESLEILALDFADRVGELAWTVSNQNVKRHIYAAANAIRKQYGFSRDSKRAEIIHQINLGAASIAEIVAETNLQRLDVASIVDDLVTDGLIKTHRERFYGSNAGRPSLQFFPTPSFRKRVPEYSHGSKIIIKNFEPFHHQAKAANKPSFSERRTALAHSDRLAKLGFEAPNSEIKRQVDRAVFLIRKEFGFTSSTRRTEILKLIEIGAGTLRDLSRETGFLTRDIIDVLAALEREKKIFSWPITDGGRGRPRMLYELRMQREGKENLNAWPKFLTSSI